MKDSIIYRVLCQILLLTLAGGYAFCENEDERVCLYCLNVGKGDCIIVSVAGHHYLIDAGYEYTYPALENALNALDISGLDGCFLTHCDKDHYGGLIPLSKSRITVDHWYASDVYFSFSEKKHPLYLAAKIRGKNVEWLKPGDVITIREGYSFSILGPIGKDDENENNNSLVLMLQTPFGNALFAGDMKREEEEKLIESGMLSACSVLKVGHHGDNNASTEALLRIIRPKAAVISTYTAQEPDTPSVSVVRRLLKYGCTVSVTQDYHDAVEIVMCSDGSVKSKDIKWAGIPEAVTGLEISMDAERDRVRIINVSGMSVNLKGWSLYTGKEEKSYQFSDYLLEPGKQVYIGSAKTPQNEADLFFGGKKRIFSKSKRDLAVLVDPFGRIICCCDNGIQ